jgi:hypothetical protein
VHTGISSLAILVATIFWTTLWGPVGLILSTPLTVCLVVLGRYVPQLKFLEVVLGDEPVLTPGQTFYQRLLAADEEEARQIAANHIKDKSLKSLYESIIIPALRLVEQDYHINGLDDDTKRFVLRATKELIEDLGDQTVLPDGAKEKVYQRHGHPVSRTETDKSVVCMPARSGADDLVAMMLIQLLQQEGYDPHQLEAGATDEMLAAGSRGEDAIVCISSLLPFATGQTRTLCRRLHASSPELKVIVGLWDFEGGPDNARERLGAGCPAVVTTTLSDALGQIRRISDPAAATSAVPDDRSGAVVEAGLDAFHAESGGR